MDTAEFRVKKLYNAAVEGDVPSLLCLLKDDPLILDRCKIENSTPFQQSPLHVAVNIGHLEFTRQIIGRKPELAEEVDQIRRWSALHIASGKGHLEIVKVLLSASPNTCLARDIDGLNPVHVAAVKGQVHVLVELLNAMPQAIRGRTNDRSTVLHLCVQYGQNAALEHLISAMDDSELLNLRDADENTVLHLAVANNQPEMVTLLLKNKRMEKNAINKNGLTAMDIISRSMKSPKNMEIRLPLEKADALMAKVVLNSTKYQAWIEKRQGELMVVATLIAGMAFQVGINPPGGSWQDDNDHHIAGHSIMADKQEGLYSDLWVLSSRGFILSLSVILLLISGLPGNRLLVWALMFAMFTLLLTTGCTYYTSVMYLTGYTSTPFMFTVIEFCYYICVPLVVTLIVCQVAAITSEDVKIFRFGVKSYRWCLSIASRRSSV